MPQDNFEMFMQLEDMKGSFAEDLKQYQAEKEPVVEIPDEPEEFADDGIEGFEGIDDNNPVFEDEEGFEAGDEDEAEDEETEDDSEEDEAEEEDEEVEESDDEVEDGDYEEGDAVDVDFDTVITLPDGREMTIEELSTGYMNGTDITTKFQELETNAKAFEEKVMSLKNDFTLAQLEADRVISDYEGFDWDKLAQEDPQGYVENRRFLDRYKDRKQQLIDAQQRLAHEAEQKEQEAFRARSVECVQVLKKSIPNWDEALYQNLLQYAIDLGSSEEEILKENRPSVFLALHKAYQFDKGAQRVVAKIKKVGAPKKVMKSGNKQSGTGDKKAAAAKAFSEGRLSHEDAFSHLVD